MRCGWSAVVRTDQEVAMLRNGDWTRQTTVPSSRAQDDDLVMSLVEVTLAQPKQERELYLSSVCAHDSELFKEVRKYVEWEERMNGFLLDRSAVFPAMLGGRLNGTRVRRQSEKNTSLRRPFVFLDAENESHTHGTGILNLARHFRSPCVQTATAWPRATFVALS